VNREIKIGQYQYKNVDVVFASADNNGQRQARQIDSLVKTKVDLLVVAPSDVKTVAPAIERAYRAGIPVILYDRMIESTHYTAYIGTDNVAIGKEVADYLAHQLQGRGTVVEITGERGSTPVADRHRGFMQGMKAFPQIQVVTLEGDWNLAGAKKLMRQYMDAGKPVDAVFGHNDAEAWGAQQAAKEKNREKQMLFVGIDGLPGENQGVDLVDKGVMTASYIYPTKGETIVPLAMNILQGKPYKRMNYFQSALVTAENAKLIDMQYKEIEGQTADLNTIYSSINEYMKMYRWQKIISILAVAVVVLLLIMIFYRRKVRREKEKLNEQRKQMADDKIAFFTNVSHQLRTPLTLVSGPLNRLMQADNYTEEQKMLLQVVLRNVGQLETLTADVLNFKEQVDAMNQASADEACEKELSQHVLRDSRHQMLLQQDVEELSTILIVDDNEDIRSYLRVLLAGQYYVIEASDGQNGLRLAKESVPDLIVSDVMMPVMDGLTFCSKIKEDEVTSHIPVILLTARSEESQRIEGYEHGADAYITKPFSDHLLLVRISNLLQARRQRKNDEAK
jgi:putative DNA-binding response regulator/sensor histidine kinase